MNQQVLVEENRNDILKNVHTGVFCGINSGGDVLNSVGDENHMTILRSTEKPFQAIPVIQNGVVDKLRLSSKEAGLFVAS